MTSLWTRPRTPSVAWTCSQRRMATSPRGESRG
jgi:hypothetical protein